MERAVQLFEGRRVHLARIEVRLEVTNPIGSTQADEEKSIRRAACTETEGANA